jgi:hypothetical protein
MTMTPKVAGIGIVGAIVVAAMFVSNGDKTAVAPPDSKSETATSAMPADESAFVSVVSNARLRYNAGANDMVKGASRPARKQALCSTLANNAVTNWVGKVSKLTTNSDGKGVLEIAIGDDISIVTWNNSLSDFEDKTLIEPDTAIYRRALQLREGQTVWFSGHFFRNDTDCIKETSLTMGGSMQEPEFLFQFVDVSTTPPERPQPIAVRPVSASKVEPPPPQPLSPASAVPTIPASTSPMFQKGLADRTDWEQWVSGLTTDYRTGAEYWAGQRSLPHPGTCSGSPAFTAGCEAAKAKLIPTDALRKTNPDYKLGWNAYGH